MFNAVTNVHDWWSEEIDGDTDRAGAEFTYQYEDIHRCRIRVTDLVPGRKVSWLVVDNYFSFTQDKAEWIGTAVNFEISKQDGGTELCFTHVGLVPGYECYAACSERWCNYIDGSLRTLITTGEGQPNGKGSARTSPRNDWCPPSPARTGHRARYGGRAASRLPHYPVRTVARTGPSRAPPARSRQHH